MNRGRKSPDERIALQIIVEYGRLQSQLLAALQMEQAALREEGCELRRLLTRLEEVRFQAGQQPNTMLPSSRLSKRISSRTSRREQRAIEEISRREGLVAGTRIKTGWLAGMPNLDPSTAND
jgi:hypothetical protein